MTETILIFNAPPKPVLLKIQKALLPLRVRIRTISCDIIISRLEVLPACKISVQSSK